MMSRALLALLLTFAVGAADAAESWLSLPAYAKPLRGGKRNHRLVRMTHTGALCGRTCTAVDHGAVSSWATLAAGFSHSATFPARPPIASAFDGRHATSLRHAVPSSAPAGARYLPNPPPLAA
jgi:hypothetical protein